MMQDSTETGSDKEPVAETEETSDAAQEEIAAMPDLDDGTIESLFGGDAARVAELEADNADLKNRFLHLAADMDNLRKRTAREVQDAKQYAIANFARDVLTVGDNLQRTLAAMSPEAREGADSTLKGLLEGVEMTERDLVNMLARHGIDRIDPMGEKFDPNAHEAVVQIPDPSVPTGTVCEVMQPGYKIGERVLRAAMVGVSAGGPRKMPAATGGDEAQPAEVPADTPPPGSTVDKTA